MRRVSYQFPKFFDCSISVPLPFSSCLEKMTALSMRQDNFRTEKGAVKREITLQIACNRLDFEPISRQSIAGVSDEADFLMSISDTVLKSDGHRPEPAQKFMVKALDRGNATEIFVAHTANPQAVSSQTAAEYIYQVMT